MQFEDIRKLVEPVRALVDEATSYTEPEVKTVLRHRIARMKIMSTKKEEKIWERYILHHA